MQKEEFKSRTLILTEQEILQIIEFAKKQFLHKFTFKQEPKYFFRQGIIYIIFVTSLAWYKVRFYCFEWKKVFQLKGLTIVVRNAICKQNFIYIKQSNDITLANVDQQIQIFKAGIDDINGSMIGIIQKRNQNIQFNDYIQEYNILKSYIENNLQDLKYLSSILYLNSDRTQNYLELIISIKMMTDQLLFCVLEKNKFYKFLRYSVDDNTPYDLTNFNMSCSDIVTRLKKYNNINHYFQQTNKCLVSKQFDLIKNENESDKWLPGWKHQKLNATIEFKRQENSGQFRIVCNYQKILKNTELNIQLFNKIRIQQKIQENTQISQMIENILKKIMQLEQSQNLIPEQNFQNELLLYYHSEINPEIQQLKVAHTQCTAIKIHIMNFPYPIEIKIKYLFQKGTVLLNSIFLKKQFGSLKILCKQFLFNELLPFKNQMQKISPIYYQNATQFYFPAYDKEKIQQILPQFKYYDLIYAQVSNYYCTGIYIGDNYVLSYNYNHNVEQYKNFTPKRYITKIRLQNMLVNRKFIVIRSQNAIEGEQQDQISKRIEEILQMPQFIYYGFTNNTQQYIFYLRWGQRISLQTEFILLTLKLLSKQNPEYLELYDHINKLKKIKKHSVKLKYIQYMRQDLSQYLTLIINNNKCDLYKILKQYMWLLEQ